jgi:hypothetical protein
VTEGRVRESNEAKRGAYDGARAVESGIGRKTLVNLGQSDPCRGEVEMR